MHLLDKNLSQSFSWQKSNLTDLFDKEVAFAN
jgi:hypothetical protein